jgi:hypothetical protein
MRLRLHTLVVAAVILCAPAIGEERHLLGVGAWAEGAVSPDALNARFKSLAAEYEPRGSLPRVALFDIAFPKDATEYAALNGYGVILISAMSHSDDELPPRRVYLRLAGDATDLTLLTSVSSKAVKGSFVERVLGPYVWEALYIFPVYARVQDAELLLDFASHREGFVLAHFSPEDAKAIAQLPIAPPEHELPPKSALLALIFREYPGFLENTPTASESSTPVGSTTKLPR